jgi:hypothetical protein
MSVFGYLDPGSGSVLLQALLGGIAGAVVAVKMFGKRVFSSLAFWRKNDEPEEHAQTASSATQATKRETEKEPV